MNVKEVKRPSRTVRRVKKTKTIPNPVQMTQSTFEYKLSVLESKRHQLEQARKELRIVAQDGTDDENPAFAQVRDKVSALETQISAEEIALLNVEIITESEVDTNGINEFTKAVKLECIYSDTESITRTFTIGHELGNLTPDSALFKFLLYKKVGDSARFVNKINSREVVSYDVTVLEIIN